MATKALEPIIEKAVKSGDWKAVKVELFADMTDFQRMQAMEAANKRLLTPEQLDALSKSILANARKMASAVRKGAKAVNKADRDAAVSKAIETFYHAVEAAYGTGVSYVSLALHRVKDGDLNVGKILVKSPSRNPFAPLAVEDDETDDEDVDGEDVDGEDVDGEDVDGEDVDGEDVDGEDVDGEDGDDDEN